MPHRKSADFVEWFADTRIKDIPLVGSKNAPLGEMYRPLTPRDAACGCSMRHHE